MDEQSLDGVNRENVTRRDFLKASMALGGGLLLGFCLPGQARAAAALAPNAWLRIGSDGQVTILVDKSEMGQGVMTALPMIVAEELDADWSKLKAEFAPAAPEYKHPWFGVQGTGGSTSVRSGWEALRKTGAAAREMLVAAAAKKWKVDAATCSTDNGFVLHTKSRRKASYGELASAAATLPVPANPKLKDPKAFKLIGKSKPRLDTPAKVRGQAQFGIDVRLPGMLVAVAARSPVIGGKLKSFDGEKVKGIPGVRYVVEISTGVAVVATSYWAAMKGREALGLQWEAGALATLSSPALSAKFQELIALPGTAAKSAGDTKTALATGRRIDSDYEVPYLAHACMEPLNCTAWVKPEGVELWVGTQGQGPCQFTAAKITGLKPEQVKVHTTYLGGGFGRRFAQDFVAEAVEIAKAVGKPVKLVYSREDDLRAAHYRPATLTRFAASLDAEGKPQALAIRTVGPSIMANAFPAAVKDGIDPSAVEGLADQPYGIPNFLAEWVRHEAGVPVWFWRSVGHSQNAFALEGFIDELAHAAGKDPYEYRRALLGNQPRARAVLELAASKAGWGKPLPKGQARGIAVHESFGSWVAQVAEVSVEGRRVRVHRVVCAIDCGQVVNPDTIVAQMESGIAFGLSAALHGAITLKDGQVEQGNFNDYPILRINEMPKVEVFLAPSGATLGGVGEPGTPPIAPAVANAVFALTGKRLRKLPLSM
ncbi:xanthine dehydrogenase YagR molybdenum-binding subunit [Burkholderiales bacterium]|nr:xanthine dehydrogenase YagR molybdenum-binding subunit [Burkholderiales bacterium]